MRWQSVARVVVALVGIGCAVAVYVLMQPRPQVTEPPPKPALLDNTVTGTSKGTKEKRVDASGRETFSWDAAETRVMADGRTMFKGVRFKFIKGTITYVVTSNEAESEGKSGPTGEEPSKMLFRKKVKMVGDDGFSVEAEEATYLGDEQRVVFPGDVVFNRDRLQGRGVGADLYMDRSVLWLNDQAHMTIKPDKGGVPVEISGKRVGLAQADGYIRAEEGTRLTREAQQLRADGMVVHFAEGTQSVRRIELVGKSSVLPTGKGQKPDMRGENIDLDFTAETNLLTHARLDTAAVLTLRDESGLTQIKSSAIDFYVGANGETLTKLEATGPTETILPRVGESPARTIQSTGLVAEGKDPKGLDRAVFSGGIQYREDLPATAGQAAAVRRATSQSLVLNLDGGLNQVKDANFRQAFCFVGPLPPTAPPLDAKCSTTKTLPARTMDDTMAAAADEGTYDAKAETLFLRSPAPKRPWVVNREVTVDAQEIDIYIKQNGIDARWDKVKTQVNFTRKPTPAQAKDAGTTGLFESSKDITVNTNILKYSKDTGRATYTGNVFMFQPASAGQTEGSVVRADKVEVDDQKHDIIATGNVRSTFFIEQTPDEAGKKGPSRTKLNSNAMTYVEAKRTAVYTGAAVMETGEAATKQSLEAEEITLVMQAEKRALKSLLATASGTGIVLAKLPEGRQSHGLQLTYDAEKDTYVMTGKQARFVTPSTTNGAGMCQVGTGSRIGFPRTGGEASVTTEGGGVGRLEDKRCAEVIK